MSTIPYATLADAVALFPDLLRASRHGDEATLSEHMEAGRTRVREIVRRMRRTLFQDFLPEDWQTLEDHLRALPEGLLGLHQSIASLRAERDRLRAQLDGHVAQDPPVSRTLTPEREAWLRNRARLGMELDPEGDVVGQDYAALLARIDELQAAQEVPHGHDHPDR